MSYEDFDLFYRIGLCLLYDRRFGEVREDASCGGMGNNGATGMVQPVIGTLFKRIPKK
jgi:hypothetical protein